MCAAFATVGEAVTAARSAQEALAAADWGDTGLSVRMAVDTGEVRAEAATSSVPAGNRCSRSAAGHGGQVLLSEEANLALAGDVSVVFRCGRWESIVSRVWAAPSMSSSWSQRAFPACSAAGSTGSGLTAGWRPVGAGL